MGGPRDGARGRPGGDCDDADPGRPRTARAGEVHAPSGPAGDRHTPANTPGIRQVAFAVEDIDAVVATCEPAARISLVTWSATKTAIGSAASAARKGSSSSWQSGSAEGSARRQPVSPASVVVPGRIRLWHRLRPGRGQSLRHWTPARALPLRYQSIKFVTLAERKFFGRTQIYDFEQPVWMATVERPTYSAGCCGGSRRPGPRSALGIQGRYVSEEVLHRDIPLLGRPRLHGPAQGPVSPRGCRAAACPDTRPGHAGIRNRLLYRAQAATTTQRNLHGRSRTTPAHDRPPRHGSSSTSQPMRQSSGHRCSSRSHTHTRIRFQALGRFAVTPSTSYLPRRSEQWGNGAARETCMTSSTCFAGLTCACTHSSSWRSFAASARPRASLYLIVPTFYITFFVI